MGKNVRGGKMKKVFLKDKIEFIDEENDCIMGYITKLYSSINRLF